MKNVNRLFTFFLPMLTFFFFGVAQAGVITTVGKLTHDTDYDSGQGAGNTLVDSLNNREWLRWDVLTDKSYTQTVIETDPLGTSLYKDYSIATFHDAKKFLDALAGGPGITTCDISNLIQTETLCQSGIPTGFFGDSFIQPGFEDWVFYLSDNFDVLDPTSGEISALRFQATFGSTGSILRALVALDANYSGYEGTMNVGLLLYKNTVPEPSIISLLVLGLFGLGFLRTRYRNIFNQSNSVSGF